MVSRFLWTFMSPPIRTRPVWQRRWSWRGGDSTWPQKRTRWVAGACVSLSGVLTAAPAAANELGVDVRACAEAYVQAQVTRNAGKLRESEAHLRICVRDVCPEFVRVDCGQWLSDVRR